MSQQYQFKKKKKLRSKRNDIVNVRYLFEIHDFLKRLKF